MYPIEFFWRAVKRYPDQPAVLGPDIALNFRTLGRLVAARAAMIQAEVPEPGAMVAVGADNNVEHLVAILAVLAAGKIWVPLNPRNGDPELRRQLDFVQPGLVLADGPMANRISGLCRIRILSEPLANRELALDMGPDARTAFGLDRTQAIKFTGGSTGAPKGVQQPLRAWNANIVTQMLAYDLSPEDRYLIAAPLTHGTSTYILPILGRGGALIFPEEPKPAPLLDAASRYRAAIMFAPPTLVLALAEEQRHRAHDLRTLRFIVYGGGPMRPEQIRDAQSCFGPVVCTSFGQTEAPQIITFLPPDEMEGDNLLSVGRPSLFTQVGVLDCDGNALPPGEQGEIAVRGDLCMTGYFKAPQESAKVLVDGWLRTGDAGVIDELGYLFLKDRLRDVIITGGFNVYPSDVEIVIAADPAVMNCAVVGVPDDKWGEAVHAAIELRPGAKLDGERLTTAIRAALGPVKTPKQLHLFEQLPRSAVGKILKPDIRAQIVERQSNRKRGA